MREYAVSGWCQAPGMRRMVGFRGDEVPRDMVPVGQVS